MADVNAHLAVAQLVPLAKELDQNKVTPGVLGFIVFAVMGLAVWFLMKSMHRHMGKVAFDEPADAEGTAGRAGVPSGSAPKPGPQGS
ncbi:hypothetical protein [Streptomyces sp. GC420]|uniref:hypothetical protein n=1 Tax=Streptomyces sp. GC420 TaxID=2697568 RepID=UPI001FB60341|nr:hypothetical protein [Streptomyces sp. GC420]